MASPSLCMIVAVAQNGVIGREGTLPWRMSDDLKFFKQTTLGKPLLMGRATYDSLGRPLPGRDNIVLSRGQVLAKGDTYVVADLERALELAAFFAAKRAVDEIAVIGGARLYAELLPRIDRIYLTRILADVEGDAFFSVPDRRDWQVTELARIAQDEKNQHNAVVEKWERTPK